MKFHYNAHYNYQNMADELIESAAERLGYVLKEEQRKVVSSLVSSEDVFGILLTGYGKSLCYTTQPHLKALQATPKAVQVIEQLTCMLRFRPSSSSKGQASPDNNYA